MRKIEKNLEKLYLRRLIITQFGKVDYVIAGRFQYKKTRKIHNFGGGKAIYLGKKEVREILKDKTKATMTVIETPTGKKLIIIEPEE